MLNPRLLTKEQSGFDHNVGGCLTRRRAEQKLPELQPVGVICPDINSAGRLRVYSKPDCKFSSAPLRRSSMSRPEISLLDHEP